MKPVVLVTAAGSAASTTITSQLRSSGEYYLIGADIYPWNQVVSSGDVDEFHSFPVAGRDPEGYIAFLTEFCREHGVGYYFATIDEEVVNVSEHRSRLEEAGVRLCIPNAELVDICHYKRRFADWIDANMPELGIRRYGSFEEADRFPVFIKPAEGRGSAGCIKAEDREDIRGLVRKGLREEDCLIEEYYDGEIITVDLVRNAKTGQKQQIQRVEFRRNATGAGLAVQIVDIPELRSICDELMERLNLNGVVNAEFFHNGSAFKIIEINPRFSAGAAFSCLAGCDIVTDAVRIASGEPCRFGTPAVGAHMAKRYESYRLD